MLKKTRIISSPCRLTSHQNQLVAQYKHIIGMEDMEDKRFPIEDLGILILESMRIDVSNYLLARLSEYGVTVIFCDEKQMPQSSLYSFEGHTTQAETWRWQMEASEPLKKQLWMQTVKQKLENQAAVLKQIGKDAQRLIYLAENVKSGDPTNCEGQGAAYYFQHLIPPAWNFKRHREGLPPNNLLNYGYAILRASMARAIVSSGLIPILGIFHRNRYNAYALADDLMEPYRPYIDMEVIMIINKTSHISELSTEFKTRLISVLESDVLLDQKTYIMKNAIQRTCVSLVKCYDGSQRRLLFPKFIS